MDAEERQFLLTTAWLFIRHGQRARARVILEALVEENPQDGVSAVALAELLLDDGDASRALDVLRVADFPPTLVHAEAVLESRALRMIGKEEESRARWSRFLESKKGAARTWVSETE